MPRPVKLTPYPLKTGNEVIASWSGFEVRGRFQRIHNMLLHVKQELRYIFPESPIEEQLHSETKSVVEQLDQLYKESLYVLPKSAFKK